MSETELKYFNLLKQKIVATVLRSHSVSSEIKNWKGQDIANFQNDLADKVQGRISEKWFYTHLKNDSTKLPRIDMLNLLSEYVGYQNWNDFKTKENLSDPTPKKSKPIPNKSWMTIGVILLVIATILLIFSSSQSKNYTFCFVDADQGDPIAYPIEILELRPKESPIRHTCDTTGCFQIITESNKLVFLTKSPYYKTDTIKRVLKESGSEIIRLKKNDYAIMIHIFSNSKINDWKKRKEQLRTMLADHVEIYQIDKNEALSVELFNKEEFINKMTMPVSSLKNIEVLETIYENDQIVKMRFRQQITE